MTRWMLDTNTISYALRQHPPVLGRLTSAPMAALCTSAVSAGELHYGLARRPHARALHTLVGEFLKRVTVLPWDSTIAEHYGAVRARLESLGITLGALDTQIAAHTQALSMVLVTHDRAFARVPGLKIEDWTLP